MNSNLIKYVYINHYQDSYTTQTMDINNFVVKLLNSDNENSYFEMLDDNLKIFLDIERIPFERPNLIYLIINDFIKFMKSFYNIDIGDYVLTCNNCSKTHYGLSYHIIFYEFYVNHIKRIKNILDNFVYYNVDYVNYVDRGIYQPGRIFKCVNQYGFDYNGIDTKILMGSYINMHRIIHGNLVDSIIQHITNSKFIMIPFKQIPKILPITTSRTSNLTFEVDYESDDKINDLLAKLECTDLEKPEQYFTNDLTEHFKQHHTFATYSVPYDILINVLTNMVLNDTVDCDISD